MMRWIVLTMLLVPCVVFAADFWDGNAALQRGDADFEGGLNVASNSFPPGTQITILDEDTGKTVTATVTGRIEGQSDILLLMSPKTAAALGVSQGTLGRVRVTVPQSSSVASAPPSDQTLSRDPDLNPAASEAAVAPAAVAQAAEGASGAAATGDQTAATGDQTAATGDQTAATGDQTAATGEQPAATGEQPATTGDQTATTGEQPATTGEQPAATGDQTATTGQAPAAAQAASPSSEDAAILSEAESRNPQKQMFQPPREDQKFVYKPETGPAQAATAQAATAPASTPAGQVASVEEPGLVPPASQQSDLPLADVTAPEESRPQEIVGTGTAEPAPSAAPQAALATPQVAPAPKAALAPPETTGAVKPAGTPPAAGAAAVASTTPSSTTGAVTPRQPAVAIASATSVPKKGPGTFYLQLAAYGSEKGARDLAAKLAPTYPALVLTPTGTGSAIFKVVIGPLNQAESGTLLTWFRYRGFPDAFLKQE